MQIETEAILFDNDGVLVDSHEQVEVAWRRLAREFPLDIDTLLPQLVGVRAEDTLAEHLPSDQVRAAVARLEELEIGCAESTRPVDGALRLIAQFTDLTRWAIVTSASRRLAEARWRGAGIPIPETTVTAEDVTQGKPHPEPFLTAARFLGVDPQRCVVFEDSASGGAAGLAAGATVVAVGVQRWHVEPSARIADLSRATVRSNGAGPLRLHLDI